MVASKQACWYYTDEQNTKAKCNGMIQGSQIEISNMHDKKISDYKV